MKAKPIGEPLHPAVYSDVLMPIFQDTIDAYFFMCGGDWLPQNRTPGGFIKVFDPFAGTGRIHSLAAETVLTTGMEIEKPWADMHPDTIHGDSTVLAPTWTGLFDMIITSPTYGNRFADKHKPSLNEAVKWVRRSYTYDIRSMTANPDYELHGSNTGRFPFSSPKYKALHKAVYAECRRVIKPGGWFVLNVSDHIRAHKLIPVAEWHRDVLIDLGFRMIREYDVPTPRMRMGRNERARVEAEKIYVMELS